MAGGQQRIVATAVAGLVLVAGATAAIVIATDSGSDDDRPPAGLVEAPPAADETEAEEAPADEATADMYAHAELTRLWDELAALPVAGVQNVYLHDEWADLEIQTAPGALTYDDISYDGELGAREPGGQVSGDDPDAAFFPLDAVDPAVVAAVAARAPEVAGRPDRPVRLIVIARDVFYGGIVTINVHLDADAYGVAPTLTWDATGQHLLSSRSDE